MRKVFKNTALNQSLSEQGYVIMQVLGKAAIQQLSLWFNTLQQQHHGFTTFAIEDYAIRKQVDTTIKEALHPFCSNTFDGYTPFWGNFFVKPPQSPAIPLHADLQYANEPHHLSLNIWLPLQEVSPANGTLGIVPYSHHAVNQIRGTNITNAYRKNNEAIQAAFGMPLHLNAGEAIIYDHRLLHYSTPNQSNQTRLALTLVMVETGAEIVHYYAETENSTTIEKYIVHSAEDFLKTPFNQRFLHLTPVEVIDNFSFSPIAVSDIQKHIPPKRLMDQLRSLFK